MDHSMGTVVIFRDNRPIGELHRRRSEAAPHPHCVGKMADKTLGGSLVRRHDLLRWENRSGRKVSTGGRATYLRIIKITLRTVPFLTFPLFRSDLPTLDPVVRAAIASNLKQDQEMLKWRKYSTATAGLLPANVRAAQSQQKNANAHIQHH
jgi:hypothetical protein